MAEHQGPNIDQRLTKDYLKINLRYMDKIIGLKELRQDVERYATAVQNGASLIVVRRSKPIFRISPVEEEWEEVVDFTKIKKGGVDIKRVLSRL